MGNKPASHKLPSGLEAKDLPEFIPPVNSGRVIKVYDGDTITVASKVPGLKGKTVYKFSVRLAGIDTPELRGKSDDEKTAAKIARDALSEKILQEGGRSSVKLQLADVWLRDVSKEKYGRLLATVYLKKKNINQWLIDERYAVAYNGGTKQSPSSWTTYKQTGAM